MTDASDAEPGRTAALGVDTVEAVVRRQLVPGPGWPPGHDRGGRAHHPVHGPVLTTRRPPAGAGAQHRRGGADARWCAAGPALHGAVRASTRSSASASAGSSCALGGRGGERPRTRRWPTSCPGSSTTPATPWCWSLTCLIRLAAGRLHGRQRHRRPHRLAPGPAGRPAVQPAHLAAGRSRACCASLVQAPIWLGGQSGSMDADTAVAALGIAKIAHGLAAAAGRAGRDGLAAGAQPHPGRPEPTRSSGQPGPVSRPWLVRGQHPLELVLDLGGHHEQQLVAGLERLLGARACRPARRAGS